MTIETLKPYIDRAVDNFGIVLDGFCVCPPDHRILTIAPKFMDHVNAVAAGNEIVISPKMLDIPLNLALAAIAHELSHIILGHQGSVHKNEYEADMTALEIVAYWNIPLESMIELFNFVGAGEDEDSRSHPAGQARIAYLLHCISDFRAR